MEFRREELLRRRSEVPPPNEDEADTDTHIGPLPDLDSDSLAKLLDEEPASLDREMKTAPSGAPGAGEVTPYSFTIPNQPDALVASLTVVSGPSAGRVFPLENNEVLIGRSPAAQIQIDDTAVSRLHARILRGGPGEYFVEDLDSKNGTFLAGHPVRRARILAGDRVHVGPNTSLRFGLVASDEVALQRRLYASSTFDSLTGALTRSALLNNLRLRVEHAQQNDRPLYVLMLDVDHFKRINDSFGHKAGDQVLRAAVERLKSLLPEDALLGRLGGEEFVVALANCSPERAVVYAERMRERLSLLAVEVGNGSVSITVSIGVASLWEVPSRKTEDLVELADKRLFAAKKNGRNRVCWTNR